MLSSLIERVASLLAVGEGMPATATFKASLNTYLRASIRHQMKRPQLARLIDIAEKREVFHQQVSGNVSRLQTVMEPLLTLSDAPEVQNGSTAAADHLALIRGLIDAAGERGEGESHELLRRTERAACGYLRS